MTTYTGTLTDGPVSGDVTSPVTTYGVLVSDGSKTSGNFLFGFRYKLTDGVVVGGTPSYIVIWGAVLQELIKLRDNGLAPIATWTGDINGTTLTVTSGLIGTVIKGLIVSDAPNLIQSIASGTVIEAQLTGSPGSTGTYQVNLSQEVGAESMVGSMLCGPSMSGIYKVSLADLASVGGSPNTTAFAAWLDTITIGHTEAFAFGVTICDMVYINPIHSTQFTYGLTITDLIGIYDTLYRFVHASLIDGPVMTDAAVGQFFAIVKMVQTFLVGGSASPKMVFNVVTAEPLDMSDTQVLNMIYAGDPLVENIVMSGIYLSPTTGNLTIWAINTRTNAVTEYQNWNFNSFAQIGRKYVAANSSGLYELNGERDEGDNIVSDIISGYGQFNGSYLVGLKGVYIGMRGQDDFYLNLDAGDGRVYNYKFVANAGPALMTTKVDVGKGLRSRYFAFELISSGPDFDLDTVEFVPMISKRRV